MLGKKLITPYIFAILSSLIMVLITGMNGFWDCLNLEYGQSDLGLLLELIKTTSLSTRVSPLPWSYLCNLSLT
jgi:hypothetical protein